MLGVVAKSLSTVAESILATGGINTYDIKLSLHTPDTKVSIDVPYIKGLEVVQEIEALMFDYLHATFDLTYDKYALVMRNEQNLMCSITVQSKDSYTGETGSVLFTKKYKVVLSQRHDPFKVDNAVSLISNNQQPDNTTQRLAMRELEIQLYDPMILDIKRVRFSFILKQSTIASALALAADKLKIKLEMVAPDNTTIYEHIIIPPSLNLSEMIQYLQVSRGYGIYDQGCNAHYVNGVLYVYPLFDTKPQPMGATCNFYYVGEDNYVGSSCNHDVDAQGNYHIICNGKVQCNENASIALENTGNAILIQDSTKVEEDWVDIADGQVTPKEGGLIHLALQTNKLLEADKYNHRFHRSRNNVFLLKSMITKGKCTIANIGWDNAVPYVIQPGSKIVYHYAVVDESLTKPQIRTISVPGICIRAIYAFRRLPTHEQEVYSCAATLIVRLDDQDYAMK